ncbi:MAG: hypothetical protein JJE21_02215 [Spirochaetaceae bacterium]|nr:hypothetical protein [Spirochaetaceae bacterium]
MINEKLIIDFTIEDIIMRKMKFINSNNIYDKLEFMVYNEGQLLAYNEMLVDGRSMSEDEFLSKYLKIIGKIKKQFENEGTLDKTETERASAYNNAIVSILELINPIYLYDLNESN